MYGILSKLNWHLHFCTTSTSPKITAKKKRRIIFYTKTNSKPISLKLLLKIKVLISELLVLTFNLIVPFFFMFFFDQKISIKYYKVPFQFHVTTHIEIISIKQLKLVMVKSLIIQIQCNDNSIFSLLIFKLYVLLILCMLPKSKLIITAS